MKDHPLVQTAGAVARYFRIDPLGVLQASHYEWAVRVAAFEVTIEAETRKDGDAASALPSPAMDGDDAPFELPD